MIRLLSCCLLAVTLLYTLHGCKSAEKSLRRGDYDESVLRAAEKLRDNPRHAASLDILAEAYPLAQRQHLDDIARAEQSADPFRYESALESYRRLNRLYNALRACPACLRQVTARSFYEEENQARQQAAQGRYDEGERRLRQGTRENARQAYEQFERAGRIIPNFRDLDARLAEAYELASFKVVVEQVLVTSRAFQLSNEYFQERVNEFLRTNRRLNQFVRFYTPEEATDTQLRPDHVIRLQFDDFVVGQTLVESKTETLTSKDSVKVGEATVAGKKVPVYNTVSAKLTRNRKTVLSSGLLDMQILDFASRRVVYQQKFPGEFTWVCEWASYNGDERALTAEQKRLSTSRELLPPPPQQLFVEFSKPIYDQLTNRLRSYYARY
jgi:tetratricopeptide (TPR) repeat protein